jgi:hypothetical protein
MVVVKGRRAKMNANVFLALIGLYALVAWGAFYFIEPVLGGELAGGLILFVSVFAIHGFQKLSGG